MALARGLITACTILALPGLAVQWTHTPNEEPYWVGAVVVIVAGFIALPATFLWFYADNQQWRAKGSPMHTDEACPLCEPDGLYARDGTGPWDCPRCGRKAPR